MCRAIQVSCVIATIILVFNNNKCEGAGKPCDIPNQPEKGQCIPPEDCPTYQRTLTSRPLKSEKINFLNRVQCKQEIGNLICCPINDIYRDPNIPNNTTKKRLRKQNEETASILNRFSDDAIATKQECGNSLGNKIIGGQIAGLDDFPWMALLIYNSKTSKRNEFGCGGVLISRHYVLTAAHCVIGPITEQKGGLISVRLGEYNTDTAEDCIQEIDGWDCADPPVDVPVQKTIPHPNYDPTNHNKHNDIAVIKMAEAVKYSDFIQPICLPLPDLDAKIMPGNLMSVAGWGKTDYYRAKRGIIPSPIKLFVTLPIIDMNTCSKAFMAQRLMLADSQICAGGKKNQDSCPGDSGSPLMYFSKNSAKWIATGIVSLGVADCGADGIPGVYTRIDNYMDWIKNALET